MKKNELIEKLELMEGNPEILLQDSDFGITNINCVQEILLHKGKTLDFGFVRHEEYVSETNNTYFHDNYEIQFGKYIVIE